MIQYFDQGLIHLDIFGIFHLFFPNHPSICIYLQYNTSYLHIFKYKIHLSVYILHHKDIPFDLDDRLNLLGK